MCSVHQNPELVARLEKIKAKQANEEYHRIMRNVNTQVTSVNMWSMIMIYITPQRYTFYNWIVEMVIILSRLSYRDVKHIKLYRELWR